MCVLKTVVESPPDSSHLTAGKDFLVVVHKVCSACLSRREVLNTGITACGSMTVCMGVVWVGWGVGGEGVGGGKGACAHVCVHIFIFFLGVWGS